MFEIDKTLSFVPVKPEEIVEVCYSVNTILVAPADHSSEPTKAYIISTRKGSALVFYIFLFLLNSSRGVIYRRDDELVGKNDYGKVMDEAFVFLESMGFILDRMDLRSLSLDERREYVQQQPFFPAPAEETPQELTEEVLEEETQDSTSPTEAQPGIKPGGETLLPGKVKSAVPGPAESSPESREVPNGEKAKAPASGQARSAASILNLWGKILASF